MKETPNQRQSKEEGSKGHKHLAMPDTYLYES